MDPVSAGHAGELEQLAELPDVKAAERADVLGAADGRALVERVGVIGGERTALGLLRPRGQRVQQQPPGQPGGVMTDEGR